jgi:adenylate kinase family enzyme
VAEGELEGTVGKLEKLAKSERNAVIEGFPKNLRQALLLQRRGVYVKNVLVINTDEEGLRALCQRKLRAFNPALEEKQLARLVSEAIAEHHL